MTKRNKNIMVKSKKMICQIKNTKEAFLTEKMLSSKYDGLFIYNNYQNPFFLLN